MTTLAFANYTLDQLENSVISYANSVNASEYQFLVALREFDLRQGWRRWLCSDCASWMNLKCKVAPATAREKLRTAIALINLPLISAAFEAGDLSYSNVRSMTRVANPDNEKVLCDFAVGATASQVEQYCRRIRKRPARRIQCRCQSQSSIQMVVPFLLKMFHVTDAWTIRSRNHPVPIWSPTMIAEACLRFRSSGPH